MQEIDLGWGWGVDCGRKYHYGMLYLFINVENQWNDVSVGSIG